MEKHEIKELAVNEQNPLARGFYEHMGFEVYKRTELDEQGNPYPLLYMKRNNEVRQNYYGSLCTEMYELLHEKAPEDELEFYLSYATKDMKILEALCGADVSLYRFMKEDITFLGWIYPERCWEN